MPSPRPTANVNAVTYWLPCSGASSTRTTTWAAIQRIDHAVHDRLARSTAAVDQQSALGCIDEAPDPAPHRRRHPGRHRPWPPTAATLAAATATTARRLPPLPLLADIDVPARGSCSAARRRCPGTFVHPASGRHTGTGFRPDIVGALQLFLEPLLAGDQHDRLGHTGRSDCGRTSLTSPCVWSTMSSAWSKGMFCRSCRTTVAGAAELRLEHVAAAESPARPSLSPPSPGSSGSRVRTVAGRVVEPVGVDDDADPADLREVHQELVEVEAAGRVPG